MSPRTPAGSSERLSLPPSIAASYEILRGGKRVASGYLRVAGTTVEAAVNTLVADISRKLPR